MSASQPAAEAASESRRWFWRWTAAVVAALVVVGVVVQMAAREHLERLAQATALQHAHALAEGVDGLESLLLGGQLAEATHHDLQHWLNVNDVFRWKLFDLAGNERVTSDDLLGRGTNTPRENGNPHVLGLAAGGRPHVELMEDTGKPGRPEVYSEAYVGVVLHGRLIGVAEVYVDQSARRAQTWRLFAWVGGSVALVLVALGLMAAWQVRQRHLAERLAEARVRHLAEHDLVTGALNRASFTDLLNREAEQSRVSGRRFAVLCIDLDHFKQVNDAHGHAAGDQVLRATAERLRACVRQCDEVARIGGDEFAVLQRQVGTSGDVVMLGQRLVAQLGQPHDLDGRVVPGGASVGAAIFGSDAHEVGELLHKADVALYRAKGQGRNAFSFYEAELDQRLQAERDLARDLREALATDGLTLHYQPLMAADGRTLHGFEALCRWQHPTRGTVSPATFIPVAEQSGQIAALGRWVLHTACREALRWPASVSVSVNLSPAQFAGDVVAEVRRALSESGLPPDRLVLELTESLLMNGSEHVIATLRALADMGVRLALDDFGTGYSSLSYLWRFPLHKLKIDRAFTQRLPDDQKVVLIVRAIIEMAHALGLLVTAEGVETSEQLEALRRDGCDELQGYLLGRPSAALEAALLAEPASAQRLEAHTAVA